MELRREDIVLLQSASVLYPVCRICGRILRILRIAVERVYEVYVVFFTKEASGDISKLIPADLRNLESLIDSLIRRKLLYAAGNKT